MMMYRSALLAILSGAALAVLAACNGGAEDAGSDAPVQTGEAAAAATATATGTASVEEPAASDPDGETRFGIAGIVPAGWPQPTTEQWMDFYQSVGDLGGTLGVYTDWQVERDEGGVPGLVRSQAGAAERFGFELLPLVGFHTDAPVALTVDWADPGEVAELEATLVAVAEALRPAYLGIGNEVNRVWEAHPEAFEAFAGALPRLADAVRAASPGTQVFTVFQYEQLRGEGYLVGGSEAREPQWALLERVAPAVDLIAFTTYPYFDYETPEAIPADYYRAAAERAGTRIAFTEVGWPGAPLGTAPDSGYGGDAAEQAAFVDRFFALTEGVDVAFAMWVFAHDPGAQAGPAFEATGLAAGDGTPRPALERWVGAVAR